MQCRRCDQDKADDDFPPHKAYATGHSTWCRECHKAANREWYRTNKAKQNAKSRKWTAENRQAAAAADRLFKAKNREKVAASRAEWGRRNADKQRAYSAKRKATRLQATPVWADKAAIANIYRLAKELQELTGVPMHVDHIVPLQHPAVCGLHCERNLQIIPARFNEAKKNYWWPDMPDALRKAYAQPDMFVQRAPEPKQEALL